ncbi:cupredoxin domain-containing protein [Comamonas thiooxydans]|uniref:cupredoxin domain-containing protein n=1 Tax=Comamonas thiooxydans TaxID=363952 RepID=UPI0001BB12C6|nr:cupredoxin family protein [Comamonas thiooxydans]ACY32307.1 multicopper oxidase [Comamonas thiooxydans]MDO1476255.1 cupredoxin family protein [Comamonas thiooxydans]
MKTIHFIAACTLAASASASFAHGNSTHASGPVIKEQKPWGIAAEAREARRTITIQMTDDMRFSPSHFSVKKGETLRLRVVNKGLLMHEMVLGTRASLDEHAQMMLKYPGMEHAEPYMAHVATGQTEDMVWSFNRAGEFDFACLIAGHYQAGMTGRFTVTE